MSKSSPQWPDGYRHWQGSFDELVQAAGDVIRALDPSLKPPTASLVRHYQHIGAVGRGQREGRAKRFGFDDLAAIVATKGLVKSGLGLDVATSVVNHSTPAMKMAYASNPGEAAPTAVHTVAALMANAGLGGSLERSGLVRSYASHAVMPSAKTLHREGPAFFGAAPGQASACMDLPPPPSEIDAIALGGRALQEIKPTHWLTLYYDPAAGSTASPQERFQAAQALERLAKTLRTG